jgi:hypothetical protein
MKRAFFAALAAVCALGLAGCANPADGSSSSDDDESSGFASNVVAVSDVSSATIWSASNVYYVSGTIYVTAALTIPAGTVVKFGPEGRLYVYEGGQVNAIGVEDAPIFFTSIKDDSAGGDSNLDAAATSPSNGDFEGTYVNANGSSFQYCVFRYGAYGLEVQNANNISVTHCTFAYNGVSTYSYPYGLDTYDGVAGLTMTDNTFYGNYIPLCIGLGQAVDASNVFHALSGSVTIGNTYNGIWVMSGVDEAVTQGNTEVAYVVPAGATIYVNASLTLDPDVCVKFGADADLSFDDGVSYSYGSAVFTSLKDDTVKGDTNGDGAASTPSIEDWEGLEHFGTWDTTSTNVFYDSYVRQTH